ncbi:MAG TPA: DUF3987 domain-containing protein, partial [Segetibacter sp.]
MNIKENRLSGAATTEPLMSLTNKNEFPCHIFPKVVQEIIHDTVECLNFPKDFIASALLHAASTAIGNTYVSSWKWSETCCSWMILIGRPGVNKSAPILFAYAPIAQRDKQFYEEYSQGGSGNDESFEEFELSDSEEFAIPKSELRKTIITDCTIQGLVVVHQNN